MRRDLQIVVVLVAVFLLVRPLDCFSGTPVDQKAADCCKKGHCSPSNPDDCCKATVQDGHELVASRAPICPSPQLHAVIAGAPIVILRPLPVALWVKVHAPPGSPPYFRLNLPLLI